MPIATDAQVQNFSDQTMRPLAESIRLLYTQCKAMKGSFDDIYANMTQQSPTFDDSGRTDNPPHLMTPADLLSENAFISAFINLCETGNAADYATCLKACVRSII